jgi:phosphate transport system substrate-binding protein
MNYLKIFLTAVAAFTTSQNANAFDFWFSKAERPYIYMVGSSTISPLMAAASEEFSRVQSLNKTPVKTPVVESSGTRNGFETFCSGIGNNYPDFVNASRPIEESEIATCNKNGVKEIVEIKIGYDGIVFGSALGSKKIKLTKEQIFLALAEKIVDEKTKTLIPNPYKTWNQIDKSLPKTEIAIYGPPLTSGTRDVFVDMVMEGACLRKKEFIAVLRNERERKLQCHKLRNDGHFIESGENDNTIVQNLKKHPNAFGILGYDFLSANRKTIKAISIDDVSPNSQNISAKKYPLSRPLFVYFKKENLDSTLKMRDFIKEIISVETIGKKGYLINNGLVAMDSVELEKVRQDILSQIN